jgi:hypothetical protein
MDSSCVNTVAHWRCKQSGMIDALIIEIERKKTRRRREKNAPLGHVELHVNRHAHVVRHVVLSKVKKEISDILHPPSSAPTAVSPSATLRRRLRVLGCESILSVSGVACDCEREKNKTKTKDAKVRENVSRKGKDAAVERTERHGKRNARAVLVGSVYSICSALRGAHITEQCPQQSHCFSKVIGPIGQPQGQANCSQPRRCIALKRLCVNSRVVLLLHVCLVLVHDGREFLTHGYQVLHVCKTQFQVPVAYGKCVVKDMVVLPRWLARLTRCKRVSGAQ